jgi:hypothetical protein
MLALLGIRNPGSRLPYYLKITHHGIKGLFVFNQVVVAVTMRILLNFASSLQHIFYQKTIFSLRHKSSLAQ